MGELLALYLFVASPRSTWGARVKTFLGLTKDTSWHEVLYGDLSTLWWGTKKRHRFSLTPQVQLRTSMRGLYGKYFDTQFQCRETYIRLTRRGSDFRSALSVQKSDATTYQISIRCGWRLFQMG